VAVGDRPRPSSLHALPQAGWSVTAGSASRRCVSHAEVHSVSNGYRPLCTSELPSSHPSESRTGHGVRRARQPKARSSPQRYAHRTPLSRMELSNLVAKGHVGADGPHRRNQRALDNDEDDRRDRSPCRAEREPTESLQAQMAELRRPPRAATPDGPDELVVR
jgi:hypothetical protein